MKIAVCVKQVLDPELPPSSFRIDPEARTPSKELQGLVVSVFDENALEVALRLKEQVGDAHITAFTVGPAKADEALRRALAVGCDDALRIDGPNGPHPTPDVTARLLAAALQKQGPFDLILCGRQAADWDMGLVGLYIAEDLDLPAITLVTGIAGGGAGLHFTRDLAGGVEVVEYGAAAVVTVTNAETNVLRIPNFRSTMMAARKQIPVLTPADLGVDAGTAAGVSVDALSIPKQDVKCDLITGDTAEDKARALARRLHDLGVI